MPLRAFPVLYAKDVERVAASTRAWALREPDDMPWGERLAFVRDPEGNIVTLAMPAD